MKGHTSLSIYKHVFTSFEVQNKYLLLENTNILKNHIIQLHRIQYFTEQEPMVWGESPN